MNPLKRLLSCLILLAATAASADTLRGGPFVVDFHPDDRKVAEETLRDLIAARDEFATHLPLGDQPVNVRIAHEDAEFRRLSGMYAHVGVSGVTRADQSAIVLKSPRLRTIGDDYRGTVRHELVHVLLHRNTDTARLPRWLNEGICMMLANEIRWESAIDVTRMHLTGQIIPITALDRAFQAQSGPRQFGDAYSQALAMTRALHDRIGEHAFWAVIARLKTEPFPDALASVANLNHEEFWRDFNGGLWRISLVTTLRTGSFWGVIAFLCLLAGVLRWRRNRRIMRAWEREESEEQEAFFDWDRILDDAEAWKRSQREEL